MQITACIACFSIKGDMQVFPLGFGSWLSCHLHAYKHAHSFILYLLLRFCHARQTVPTCYYILKKAWLNFFPSYAKTHYCLKILKSNKNWSWKEETWNHASSWLVKKKKGSPVSQWLVTSVQHCLYFMQSASQLHNWPLLNFSPQRPLHDVPVRFKDRNITNCIGLMMMIQEVDIFFFDI